MLEHLAWRVKKIQSDRAINSIISPSGNLTVDLFEINNRFREFYEHLYRSECPQTSEVRDTFLDHFKFQTLTEDVKNNLDSGLTITENITGYSKY